MRANDQEVEDEGIDVMDKEESGSPEPVSKGWPPQEVEVRAQGVWAKWNIYRGMRLGPFLGRWTSEKPADPNNYWEVSRVIYCIQIILGSSGLYRIQFLQLVQWTNSGNLYCNVFA